MKLDEILDFDDLIDGFTVRDVVAPTHNSPYLNKLLEDQHKLYEGLIKSYSSSYVIWSIKREVPTCKIDYEFADLCKITAIFNSSTDHETIKKLIHKVETCGWYVASAMIAVDRKKVEQENNLDTILQKFKVGQLCITIEAKYGMDVKDKILKKYKILYHITPTASVDKILEIGLAPRSKSKISYHPDRIYLSTSLEALKQLKPKFVKTTRIIDWTALKIDASVFNRIGNGTIVIDPNFKDEGLFTLSNIPPGYITIEGEI